MKALALSTAAVLALAPGVAGAATHAEQVGAAFDSGATVFVAPSRAKLVDAAAVARLQARIDEAAGNRIHIAVVPKGWVKEEGSVGQFTDAVAGDRRGAVLVDADGDAYVVTSYEDSEAAQKAVQQGFDEGGGEAKELGFVVDNLAGVDPGRSGDLDGGDQSTSGTFTIPKFPDANKIVDDVTGTIKFVFILIAALIVAPILFFVVRGAVRGTRERAMDKERLADAIKAADDERTKLGDDIVDLDTATSMPNVPEQARKDYEAALDAYDSSELKLREVDSPSRLSAVQKIIADGRAAAARARAATGTGG